MFNFIEKHKKLIQVLLGLIGVTFAGWGIQSYTSFLGPGNDVATVDGVGISHKQFTDELRRQEERLRQLFGNGFDVDKADTPQARRAILESMVRRVLLAEQAAKARLTVSNDALRTVIASQPVFQEKGQFSDSRYRQLLRAQGMTPVEFENQLRGELAVTELTRSISASAIVPRSVTQRIAALQAQKREVSEAFIPAKGFFDQVKLDPAQVKAYYTSHTAAFRVPERVRAEYVVFSPEALGAQETVTDAELKAYYESHLSQFRTPAERRASHILITVPATATPAQKQAARDKAEHILAEVRKSPSDFAALAKKYSQDPGSADKGGDLGYFQRNAMVKPFANAVFGMTKVGQIVGPVETQFGYHIIELTGIRPSKTRTFDEVRDELSAELRQQKGLQDFNSEAGKFSDMVYEQSDSLKPVAQHFHLTIKTTGWVERGANPALGQLNNPKLISALFSNDSLKDHRNTDAIEVAPNVLVSAHVVTHEAARERKFDEVKDEIEQTLRQQEAAELAKHDGEAKLARLEKGDKITALKWKASEEVSRLDPKGVAPDALARIMAANPSKLPAYVGLEQGKAGFAVYRVSKVIEAKPASKQENAERLARAEREAGAEQLQAYLEALRAKAKVKIHEKNLRKS